MNVAFIDLSGIDFTPLTPETVPLGGMQSGLCYLSRALRRRGHRITLINGTTSEGDYDGVRAVNFGKAVASREFHEHDVFVSISCAGRLLRPLVGSRPLILYTGHNRGEPSMQALQVAEEQNSWDFFIFKSNWQAEALRDRFSLDHRRIRIITNAVAPFFHEAPERTSFFFNDCSPPVLYFSSTPFRGLGILCQAFPFIRRAIPGVTAKIFSSMKPYHGLADDAPHRPLYEACRDAGLEYVGSLGQRSLAREVMRADVLAFPSTYPETSCVTIMEAMASSALVVTRPLGAIPETTAGFARLMPAAAARVGPDLPRLYAEFLADAIRTCQAAPRQAEARLSRQRRYSTVNYSWDRKAGEWEALLEEATATRSRGGADLGEPQGTAAEPTTYNYVQTIHGKRIYIDPRDARAKRMIVCGGTFNPETVHLWTAALGLANWDVIVDVGANYGEMLIEPGVERCPRVLAVEPNPRVLPWLSKTLATAGNVTIVPRAIADTEGERAFAIHATWSGMSCLGNGPTTIMVKTTTVDSLLSGTQSPGTHEGEGFRSMKLLLKVDVEGGEPGVLSGAVHAVRESADFCCLIEISHLEPAYLRSLEQQFLVFALHRGRRRIEQVESIEAVRDEAFGYWSQDVILRRRDK